MAKLQGREGFNTYYKDIYNERWDTLKESLLQENVHFTWYPSENSIPYYLDSASVLAAFTLPVENAETILDMCAAPGGKSLILAHRMNNSAKLLCNERSASRRNRLVTVLNEHLPDHIRKRVNISSNDGALMCKKEAISFDAILLDAPCSSERHVLTDEKYLNQWTSARVKNLAVTQWSLLSSGFRLLKEGGHILYSTCALSHVENDDVIKKLLKKFDNASIVDIDINSVHSSSNQKLPNCEKTELGYHVLPDLQNGAGPIYFSLIYKADSKIKIPNI